MSSLANLSPGKKLFTPGPLTVSPRVRVVMNQDVGSRDETFIQIVRKIRQDLVSLSGLDPETHTCVLLQGSGTFSVESVLNSTSDRNKTVLLLTCGAYGARMESICRMAGIRVQTFKFPENQPITLTPEVLNLLASGNYGALAVVHCETTSGLINHIEDIGKSLKGRIPGILYIVDAMSSFGGVIADYSTVDFLISSSNKCLQGVPGFAFVICKTEKLKACSGRSTSLSLDLYEQWKGLESNGQFRFTPPTHVILAFAEALEELKDEGGIPARAARYKENNTIIKTGMKGMGFRQFVNDICDGHIITSFKYPEHANFNFETFYQLLSGKGQVIYPGKVTDADCFRIGNVGHLFPDDMRNLLVCIREVLEEMKVPIPVSDYKEFCSEENLRQLELSVKDPKDSIEQKEN